MNLLAALMLDYERQDLNFHPQYLRSRRDRIDLLKTVADIESGHSIAACADMMHERDALVQQVAA